MWKECGTTSRAGCSRNLQYVEGTGRISVLNNQGPQGAGDLAEGEFALEDTVVEALLRSEVHGRAFREGA